MHGATIKTLSMHLVSDTLQHKNKKSTYFSLMSAILTHAILIHIFYRLGVIRTVFCLPYYHAHFVHFISFNLKHTKYEILVSLVCTPSEQQT